jgi:uridylate kinase
MKQTKLKSVHTKSLEPKYKKIKYHKLLLKISGEILGSEQKQFDQNNIAYIIEQIAGVVKLGVKIGIVVGGGNIMRGRDTGWFDHIDADICGMLATIINGVIIQSHLKNIGIATKLSSGLEVKGIVEKSNKFEDAEFYDSGGVIIYVGGTGNPLFTTDTAAALRAAELNADILVKATKVEGIYSADPVKNPGARLYKKLTFQKAIDEELGIMDLTAFNICRKTNTPILVYNLMKYSLSRVVKGENLGTLVLNGV